MTTTFTTRTYASSSAANRAIRQFEEKHGKSNLVMTKIDKGIFQVGVNDEVETISFDEFKDTKPNVDYSGTVYRYFPDGEKGEGYYELKTGSRRRPNSKFINLKNVHLDIRKNICSI